MNSESGDAALEPDNIAARLPRQLDLSQRQSWQPPLSGDIDIRIDCHGRWFHCGDPFTREKIVHLFCQLLRRDGDDYFLVTPVEKWRIQVEAAPLLVTEVDVDGDELLFTSNDGSQFQLDEQHQLSSLPYRNGTLPVVEVRDGLLALLPRHHYYWLAELVHWQHGCAWLGAGNQRQQLPMLE